MKTCSACKQTKELDCFGTLRRIKSGLRGDCKDCVNTANRKYKANNREKVLAGGVKYREENREKERLRGTKYRLNNPDAVKASQAKHFAAHRDEVLDRAAKYRAENPEKCRAKLAKYRAENPERMRAFRAAWAAANPAKIAASTRKRQAAKLLRTPSWANDEQIKGFYETSERLYKLLGIKMHVDHIVPLQGELVSGLHVPANLQVIPATVNVRKSNTFEV